MRGGAVALQPLPFPRTPGSPLSFLGYASPSRLPLAASPVPSRLPLATSPVPPLSSVAASPGTITRPSRLPHVLRLSFPLGRLLRPQISLSRRHVPPMSPSRFLLHSQGFRKDQKPDGPTPHPCALTLGHVTYRAQNNP